MRRIIKGDQVIILTGKDKGKRGAVLNVLLDKKRVLVEGINLIKKHQRGDPQKGVEGGIVVKEASLHISNVAIYNAQTEKADRVKIVVLADGTKARQYVSNGENIIV